MILKKSKTVIGLLLLGMVFACTQSLAENGSGYSVDPLPRYDGDTDRLYYLIKADGKWTASKTGDTKNENVEAVIVDARTKKIILYAWGERSRAWQAAYNSGKPVAFEEWKCSPGIGKNERETGGNNICLSEFSDGLFSVKVDQDKLLDAAQSSGLIAMAEQDYQAELVEIQKRKDAELAAREKAEQTRLAADHLAEEGDASAKYQRGMFYLGTASFNIEAEKWMKKAAAQGHADALYKLAIFQNIHYRNTVEAEYLINKAAQAGSKEARAVLEERLAEQKRIDLQEKQVAAFRKSISSGDESNCGPVIEVKGKLVKVAFAVENYGNEHWVRRDDIYPSGWGCRFVNGQYKPPR